MPLQPIVELNCDSPAIQQPEDIDIALKPHQLTAVYKCLEIESNPITITANMKVRTKIGVIGDDCGSGKSFIVMALLTDRLARQDQMLQHGFCRNKFIIESLDVTQKIKTKLLLIPHTLLNQWTGYLKYIKNRNYIVVGKNTTLRDMATKGISTYDFIVVTSTMFKGLLDMVTNQSLKFDRFIVDEADQIKITPCYMDIEASFYWFVSACPVNFMHPTGMRLVDSNGRYFSCKQVTGIKHTGYIRNMFSEISHTSLVHNIVVKNEDAYVRASFTLLDVIFNTIRCKSSQAINVLYGIVNKNIMNCLNADDMDAAMGYISVNRKGNETNVISMLMEKFERNLANIGLELDFNNLLQHESVEAKTRIIERIEKEMEKVRTDIENVKRRLTETHTCCICYDDIEKKAIVPCCSNAFCFKCINTWMSTSSACPLCKARISSDLIYVVHEDRNENLGEASLDKYGNLERLLKTFGPERRVLIFSEFDPSLEKIKLILNGTKMTFSNFKGHSASIARTIDNYKKGVVQVILANTNEFGYGMNLEMTTDVILFHRFTEDVTRQAIGRAQRSGRTTQLNVWKLLHDNEMPV